MERFEENVSSEASDFEDESQDDGEEIGEQFSSDEEEIRPYQFEPELDENYPNYPRWPNQQACFAYTQD